MALPFGGRRRRIREAYDALRSAMATASGASAAAAEAAREAHLAALVELWLREAGLDAAATDPALRGLLTNPAFTAAVHAVEADRSTTAARPQDTLPELDEIVAKAAPRSAGSPPESWLGKVETHTGVHDVPALWRIGIGRLTPSGEPFDVALPLLDEAHLQIGSHPDARGVALGLVENLLLRVVSHFRPGLVAVHLWDVAQINGPLPRLHPLTRTGIVTVHDPRGLGPLLDALADRVRRVHRRVLGEGMASVADWARELRHTGAAAERPEPWTVVVLVGDRRPLREEENAALARIARGGLACGVQLVLLDVPITLGASVETVDLGPDLRARTSMTGAYGRVAIEPRFAAADVARACHAVAEEHESWRNRISTLDDLLGPLDRKSSQHELRVPIGFDDAAKVDLVLDDSSPHALVGGPSGSGKTNLLLAWIAALSTRYSPDELALYLLDFKEGVSFAQFAPGRSDPSYLPHARLLGLHVNTDREFGLALLQFLADEMRRRAAAAKDNEVTKLADLREKDPVPGRWPRIVAVIDEFQYLFAEKDAVTRAATILLEDVARRGRSQGIHLVLASQDVSGIDAFWGRAAIFEQFVLRIALPRARRVLDDRNEATLDLPRWHAVINHESGMRHANAIVRVPDASAAGLVDQVRHDLHKEYGQAHPAPSTFDGSRAPRLDDLLSRLPADAPRLAVIGQNIDVEARPATVELPTAPGRNLAVLGTGAADAVRVLEAAVTGVARTTEPGTLDFVLVPLVAQAQAPVERLAARLSDSGHIVDTVGIGGVRARIEELAAEVTSRLSTPYRRTTVLVLYAADAADAVLDRVGTEALRRLVHFGPETGVHLLGWWRSVPRLRALLTMGPVVDDIGAWVALDVQGMELQQLLPSTMFTWSPRPGRGLFFDRAQHSAPRVVVVPGADA